MEDRIPDDFGRKKVIVILGARQVGKTTLMLELTKRFSNVLLLNCDDIDDVLRIEEKSSTELKALISGYDAVLIDEAQRVKNIGLTVKKIRDLKLDSNVILTGSSSLDLADEINEPATGRTIDYNLYPLSLSEMAADSSETEEGRMLESRMIYGLYPEAVNDPANARRMLMSLTDKYLYKDLLSFGGVKKPALLQKLVLALALQLGSEVSYNELSNLLGIDRATVESYISLLEKCFVVFRLDSFSRNIRNEIRKGKKVYFYDNGVRNAVISNFSPLELRTDAGALWENLMVSERMKRNSYAGNYARLYFWRTHEQQEIDLLEEQDGRLRAFEFKWKPGTRCRCPASFASAYGNPEYEVITPENFWHFVK